MRLPKQAPAVKRHVSVGLTRGEIQPSDCPWYKAIACAGAVVACAAACASGPEACIPCFAALGSSSCIDCV